MPVLPAHAARRQAYMDAIGPRAVAVIHSPPEVIRNGDASHAFRQSSDILYLTGFDEPQTTLVLRPGAEDSVVMFVRPRDPETEIWDGRRAGVAGAKAEYGAQRAYPVSELDKRLSDLIANADELYYSLGLDPAFDALIAGIIAKLRGSERKGKRAPRAVIDPRSVLHEMRLIKDESEVALLRRAAEISAEAHNLAMKEARPGIAEYQLEALVDYTFRRHGGTGPGYQTIVGSGANATILHYIDNDRTAPDGDLVLIDAGCEYGAYTADITRTFPVNGHFSAAQRRVYQVVLDVQKSAIEMVRPGATIDGIHEHCVARLTQGMIDLGLLAGTVESCIADESYRRFYMHRTSHWLGLDVHDAGAYTVDGVARPLEPGMVITVEPGLYIAEDAEGVADEYRGIGVRIEDDILVTGSGYENLTAAAVKEVDEIEGLMG